MLVLHACIRNIGEVLRDRIVLHQTLRNVHKTFVIRSHHMRAWSFCNRSVNFYYRMNNPTGQNDNPSVCPLTGIKNGTNQDPILICALAMKDYFLVFQRTPAPSSGLPINSMPAFSNASLIASSVLNWAPGTPSADSSLCIEEKPTPDFSDKSDLVQSSIPLAARIWALVIKSKWSYNELLWTTCSL